MGLINTSIKSFFGQKSALASRNSGSGPSKVYSPVSGFGGSNDFAWDGGAGGNGQFGGNDSISPGLDSQNQSAGSSGWWMCVIDSNLGAFQIQGLHIESANIRKPKRFIHHPVETGTVVVDHAVEDPWTADVRGIVEDEHYSNGGGLRSPVKEVEETLEAYYHNKQLDNYVGFILGKNGGVITNKNGVPVKFHLADYSGRVAKDRIGIFEYDIRLQEIITTEQAQESTSDPENSDTQKG